MNELWTEGEPTVTGYYLVLVRAHGHPQGNPWVFLARVVIDDRDVPPEERVNYGRPLYMDHHSGSGKWDAYTGGHVVGYCDPTPENFARALTETQEFYEAQRNTELFLWSGNRNS